MRHRQALIEGAVRGLREEAVRAKNRPTATTRSLFADPCHREQFRDILEGAMEDGDAPPEVVEAARGLLAELRAAGGASAA